MILKELVLEYLDPNGRRRELRVLCSLATLLERRGSVSPANTTSESREESHKRPNICAGWNQLCRRKEEKDGRLIVCEEGNLLMHVPMSSGGGSGGIVWSRQQCLAVFGIDLDIGNTQ